jgi:hypothetical protein
MLFARVWSVSTHNDIRVGHILPRDQAPAANVPLWGFSVTRQTAVNLPHKHANCSANKNIYFKESFLALETFTGGLLPFFTAVIKM